MAAVLENEVCGACGADVRPQALFCYNCGGAVAGNGETAAVSIVAGQSESLTKENKAVEKPLENPVAAGKKVDIKESEDGKKTNIQQNAKLKSAAMRRRSKSFQAKKIEVVWEEHENAPNVLFLAAAVFLTLVAAAVLFLAIYLK